MKPNAKTQSDQGLKFDGAEVLSQNRSNKFRGNKSGLTGVTNAGRGPRVGNDGSCHDPISGARSAKGAPKSVPDTHAKSAPGMPQYRGVGGTTVKKPGSPDRINAGAGPRKGNQQ